MTPEEEKAIFKWAIEHAEEIVNAVPPRKKDWRDWLAENCGGNAGYIGACLREARDRKQAARSQPPKGQP